MTLQKQATYTFLWHIGLWLVYILLEYVANYPHIRPDERLNLLWVTIRNLPLIVIPTYIMAWYAVPRFLKEEKLHYFALTTLIVAGLVFIGRIKWLELMNYLATENYYSIPATKVIKNVIRDYSIIALAVCIYIISDWRKKSKANVELIKAKAEVEIQLLKGQLQPHFLFNSLNNIYSLALSNSRKTADSILKLTELLDYLVYKAGQPQVAISREWTLIENYVELEKLRYGDKLSINTQVAMDDDQRVLPPLILLPFVENCFKHGGPGNNGIFSVFLDLKVTSGELHFHVENTIHLMGKTRKKGGIGLKNIRKRLELIFPDRHDLMIENDGSNFTVDLKIQFDDQ